MKDSGYYNHDHWDTIYGKLVCSGTESKARRGGYATKVKIGAIGNAPTFTAEFNRDVTPFT